MLWHMGILIFSHFLSLLETKQNTVKKSHAKYTLLSVTAITLACYSESEFILVLARCFVSV